MNTALNVLFRRRPVSMLMSVDLVLYHTIIIGLIFFGPCSGLENTNFPFDVVQ